VGLQDPGYFLYWEGVDWAQRFGRAGWESWFCPTAEVVHVGGVSVGRARLRSVLWSHAALYRYFRKWSRVPRPLLASIIGARALGKLAAVSIGYRKTQPPFVPSP
jgi:GT2 family glycosyltransferase